MRLSYQVGGMSLHPDFPVVSGRHTLTRTWVVGLPGDFNRRVEDEGVCIWRPGLTLWFSVWSSADERQPSETLTWLRSEIAPDAYDVRIEPLRLSYRLAEQSDDARVSALYGFVVAPSSYLQFAAYADDETDLDVGRTVFDSAEAS